MRSTSVPVPHEVADGVPELDAAARIETGRRLVEQQQLRRADEAGAEVELAPHAARVRLHPAIRGCRRDRAVRARASAFARAPARAGARTAGRSSRGSRDRSSSVRPPRTDPASPISRRTSFGCLSASTPATCRLPESGFSSVATERTKVVLPAPFGPSSATTCPSLGDEVEAVERAYVLVRAS